MFGSFWLSTALWVYCYLHLSFRKHGDDWQEVKLQLLIDCELATDIKTCWGQLMMTVIYIDKDFWTENALTLNIRTDYQQLHYHQDWNPPSISILFISLSQLFALSLNKPTAQESKQIHELELSAEMCGHFSVYFQALTTSHMGVLPALKLYQLPPKPYTRSKHLHPATRLVWAGGEISTSREIT